MIVDVYCISIIGIFRKLVVVFLLFESKEVKFGLISVVVMIVVIYLFILNVLVVEKVRKMGRK